MIITQESFLEQVKLLEFKESLHQEKGIKMFWSGASITKTSKPKDLVTVQKGSGKKENDWAVRKMNVGQRPRYPSVKGRVEY